MSLHAYPSETEEPPFRHMEYAFWEIDVFWSTLFVLECKDSNPDREQHGHYGPCASVLFRDEAGNIAVESEYDQPERDGY